MNSNHDMAWPSYARIIEETGLSRATVAKYIKILEQEGWIKRESGNSTTNTVYFAILPEIISDEVKEFDDRIQLKLKGSSPDKLRSTPAKQGVVREVNTNTQLNKQSNNQYTDTFSGKQKEMVNFRDLNREDYPLCAEAMNRLNWLHISGSRVHNGKLSVSEWDSCELAMASVDCFDCDYFDWWLKERSQSMRKTPSLPNMLTDMNGITFEQFYNSTFLQEWE
jgi:DNA-binding MarR family transcriptional regulator